MHQLIRSLRTLFARALRRVRLIRPIEDQPTVVMPVLREKPTQETPIPVIVAPGATTLPKPIKRVTLPLTFPDRREYVASPHPPLPITSPLRKHTTKVPAWKVRHWLPTMTYQAHSYAEPLYLVAAATRAFCDELHWLPAEVFLSRLTYDEYRERYGSTFYYASVTKESRDHEIAVRPWPGLGRDVCVCSGVA